MEFGSTHHWSKKWWKQALRGSEHTSRGGRTQSHIILQRKRFWTSVRGLLGGHGHGCLGGGGNMTVYIWEGEKKRAAALAESYEDETIGEEEGMYLETTTGRE